MKQTGIIFDDLSFHCFMMMVSTLALILSKKRITDLMSIPNENKVIEMQKF